MECTYGTPAKYYKKVQVKAGDKAHKGEVVRYELKWIATDDMVKAWCDQLKDKVCYSEGDWHGRYFYASNTNFIMEADALNDHTFTQDEIPSPDQGAVYRLLTFWQAYKTPIILGAIGAVGTGILAYIVTRRK